jgi:hypothetical protein
MKDVIDFDSLKGPKSAAEKMFAFEVGKFPNVEKALIVMITPKGEIRVSHVGMHPPELAICGLLVENEAKKSLGLIKPE